MNHSIILPKPAAAQNELIMQDEPCEICSGNSEEDLYIVFNALCKIMLNESLGQKIDQTESQEARAPISLPNDFEIDKNSLVLQENIKKFQKSVSGQSLIELVALPRFDLLLREIFKIKYNRAHELTCKHKGLAVNFIKKFNLQTNLIFEESDLIKKNLMESSEKIDLLYIKVKQFKLDIELYHSQIDGLSDKIINRLLSKNSQQKKDNENNRKISSDQEAELMNPFIDKKIKKDNLVVKDVPSSLIIRRQTSSTESKKSEEISDDESQSVANKKTKTATFKSKLPKKATDILKEWFLSNIQNPYPHHDAKENLSRITGLTRKQIQNWFTNSRKRFLEPLKKKIDNNKSSEVSQKPEDLTPVMLSQTGKAGSLNKFAADQSILLNKQIASLQAQQLHNPNLLMNSMQNLNPNLLKMSPQPMLSSPNLLYPGTVQTIFQPANNVVVLPWAVSQPMYPYHPGLLPLNPTQTLGLNQNVFGNNYPLVRNMPLVSNQIIQSLQAGGSQMMRQNGRASIPNNIIQHHLN